MVKPPAEAALSVPPQFTVKLFATGLSGPRLLHTAPNGDIFIAETGRNRIRVLRADDGADAPSQNQIFADGLDRPFGLAFYPPGGDPQWIYAANNNSVVRIPYRNGDLKARGAAEVIMPRLTETTGRTFHPRRGFFQGRQAHVYFDRLRLQRRGRHEKENSR